MELEDAGESTLNLAELLTRVDNDRELLIELLQIFTQECGPLLQSLREAVSGEDMKRVETTSHTLKGMLASLAASRAASAAFHLEQLGNGREKGELKKALAIFESEIAILRPIVEAYLEKAGQ